MGIKRIVPNINSSNFEESKKFYTEFLGLNLAMDMAWILTFISATNPQAQVSIVKKDQVHTEPTNITITIEVENIDNLYELAISSKHEIIYPLTEESWGVTRFFVKDPNGVIINVMCHT